MRSSKRVGARVLHVPDLIQQVEVEFEDDEEFD